MSQRNLVLLLRPIPDLFTTMTWAVRGIPEVRLPSLSILEADHQLGIERDQMCRVHG